MFGNIGKMMKAASAMKTKLPEMQAQIEATRHTADAGGGVVSATVSGKGQIVDVKISPEAVTGGDCAMLEDLVQAAVAAAQDKAAIAATEAMAKLAEDLGLPPGMEEMIP